ncbi:MAG: TRAP transporter substrate-binding protein [Gammaproteobacteria bacterium]|nr:TRAP transporter substrate-binding protein [Gammaproteobacteria bacterium]
MRLKHAVRSAFAACIAVVCAAGCEPASPGLRLTLGHSLEPTHTVHHAMVFMDERLRALSGGTMYIDIYPSGQLGSEREAIELLQIGSLAMTKVSASPLEGFVPTMKIFNLPYLFRDHRHYLAVLDSAIGQELLLAPLDAKLRGLGYYDAGSRSFYTTDRQVGTPGDLDGLKIRVQQSQTAMQMVSALGGSPTPIAWGELYTALQQGVVDGAENNPPSFYTSGHYEVARYFTLDEHTAVPDLILISTRVWDSLTSQQQAWLTQAVDESVVYQRELWQRDTRAALEAVAAAGVEILQPDKRSFEAVVGPMLADYEQSELGPLIRRIRALDPDYN